MPEETPEVTPGLLQPEGPPVTPKNPMTGAKANSLVTGLLDTLAKPENRNPILLHGWLGQRNAADKRWQLYLTPRLDQGPCIDFEEQDVIAQKSLETTENPVGGTLVWLKQGSNVKYVYPADLTLETLQQQSPFLSGGITNQYMQPGMPGLPNGSGWTAWIQATTFIAGTSPAGCGTKAPAPGCPV